MTASRASKELTLCHPASFPALEPSCACASPPPPPPSLSSSPTVGGLTGRMKVVFNINKVVKT